jgi:hypothetical protein
MNSRMSADRSVPAADADAPNAAHSSGRSLIRTPGVPRPGTLPSLACLGALSARIGAYTLASMTTDDVAPTATAPVGSVPRSLADCREIWDSLPRWRAKREALFADALARDRERVEKGAPLGMS